MNMAAFPKYESYQDSGVEWVGAIPASWRVQRGKWLFKKMDRPVSAEDEIVTCFRDGMVTLRANRRTEGFTNALKEHGYQGIRKGDLVIHAMDAFAGAVGVSDSDGKSTPVYSACVPRVQGTVNPHFYAYYMRHIALSGLLVAMAKGIRERSTDFRFNDFADLALAAPPIEEQTAIVAFLDGKCATIDEAVRIKEEQIALLRERRQILIQQAVTRGLNPSAPMKDSGIDWIGQIPAHWEIENPKWLFEHRKQRAIKGEKQLAATQKYGVIPQDEFMELEGRRVVVVFLDFDILKHVEAGDFVMSMRSFQGGLEYSEYTGCVSSAYVALKPGPQVNARFYKYLFKSKGYIQALQTTSNLVRDGQALRFDNFAMVPVPVVPLAEQEMIASELDDAFANTDKTIAIKNDQIAALKEYKTSLINAAVTGKIRVT